MFGKPLSQVDPEMHAIISAELERQQRTLMLIPSENYASPAVMSLQGSVMTNKYAEGYPGARYYNGCAWVDAAEALGVERAQKLFHAEYANLQPHTGSQANMAAYYALIEQGDTILAMSLEHGGHLTHGKDLNFSGRFYKAAFYGVNKDSERIEMEEVREIAVRCQPKIIVVGASAYPRTIDFAPWQKLAEEVGAYLMADIAHIVGLVAAGVHPSPVPHADVITSTTHKTLRGPRGALILAKEEHAKPLDRAVFPGVQAGPLMHVIAAKTVALAEAMTDSFKMYQKQIVDNAQAMAQSFLDRGIRLVSGGTDNHLMILDLTKEGVTGREAADLLESVGIVVNKNCIPFDPRSPLVTSGIRPGTPALTTRGLGVAEMEEVGDCVCRVIRSKGDDKELDAIRKRVDALCEAFPIYEELSY